ncbi:MAG TPA: hypothetical protein P5121_00105 [Caldilineaceae bacterium]|nr:hypothetical protein [Caldilineaceae bacterium]
MATRFTRIHLRLLLLLSATAILSVVLLRDSLPSGAQAGADCSPPYLVAKTFTNGARWQLCWEQRNLDGIVLRKVYFTPPGGIQTQVLALASISQVHVPYDDNSARFHDITDDGFGNENLNDLTPEECLGGTLLKDGAKDVLCQQVQLRGHAVKGLGIEEQGEWLSLFSVSTSGEYNYIPVWRFLDDGAIEMVMGATGKLQRFTNTSDFGWPVRADGTLGTSHIHNYYWRLDFDLGEKADDDLVEEFNYLVEAGAVTPRRILGVTPLTTESGRSLARQSMRSWRIRDGALTNVHGRPISYQLEPMQIGHRDVGPANEPWTANDFYVTKFKACEKYVSHNPQIDGCGNNLADFVNGESLVGADLVLWYGLTFHHIPRDEDEAYMHAHWDGFRLVPRDWMAENATAGDVASCAVGDVTCDQMVDAADALFMLQHNVQLRGDSTQLPLPANTLYRYACDVSGEGACNQVDALFTLQCAVGLTNRFCPGAAGLGEQATTGAATTEPVSLTIGRPQAVGQGMTATTNATTLHIPLELTTVQPIGSAALVLSYTPRNGQSVTCQSEQTAWDMNLCTVDATTGTVRFSALATSGKRGRLQVGTLEITGEITGTDVEEQFPQSESWKQTTVAVQTLTVTDTEGKPLPTQLNLAGFENHLYLPWISMP